MGRSGFGNARTFRDVVEYAHERGLTTSGDLLFNQPSQSLAEMLEDVDQAIESGLDQICLYHLVLFQGLERSGRAGLSWFQACQAMWKRLKTGHIAFLLDRPWVWFKHH